MSRLPVVPKDKPISQEEDERFRLLRQVDQKPDASQRVIASALDLSLGRVNTLLRGAIETGFIDIADRDSGDKRSRVAYALTAKGATEKRRLTEQFLAAKPQALPAYRSCGLAPCAWC